MIFAGPSKSFVGLWIVWLGVAVSGYWLLGGHQARPGDPGLPPTRWPEGVSIPLDRLRPTLLIFLHPRCPCSRSSVAELAEVAASYGDRFASHAIVYQPDRPSREWDRAEAATTARDAIAGLGTWRDRGGKLGRRFGVATSGHVLLFAPSGKLLFSGGITPSRGHRGENFGLETLVARIKQEEAGPGESPVFGCPLFDPDSRPETGRSR